MAQNRKPISLRKGYVILDGEECMDLVKCSIKFTPDVWTGREVGEEAPSTRWLGYSITATITQRRSKPFLKEALKRYEATGDTPEFTIQGVMDDKGSDYYKEHGSEVVTVTGCVPTGDISLIEIDSGGDVLEDAITFNCKSII